MKWLRVLLWTLTGVVLLLASVPLFVSLNDYVLLVEKEVSAKLNEPVKIAGLRAGGLPLPHVIVDGISIGKTGIVTAARVTITPDLWSLLGSTKVIRSIRIDRLVLTQKAIEKIPSWTKAASAGRGEPASTPGVTVKSIRFDQAQLMLQKAPFGPFDGRLTLNGDNSLDVATITTADGKLRALIKPEHSYYRVDAKATDWKLPLGPALRFDDLIVSGIATANGLRLTQVRGGLYGGRVTGEATLTWHKGFHLKGKAGIESVELRSLLVALGKRPRMSGKLNAKPFFHAAAARGSELQKALYLETQFDVHDGMLGGVDISKAATSVFRDENPRAVTRFNELSGHLVLEQETRRFTKLKIAAGSLSARGRVTISPQDELSGRLDTNIDGSKLAATSMPLNVSGTVDSPTLLPTAGVAAGAAVGTAILGPAGTALGTAIGAKLDQLFNGGESSQ